LPVVRQDRRATDKSLKWRRAFSTGWRQLVENALSGERARVKARARWLGSSPMEGTSGAADLEALRGASGEAALGPGCVGLREQFSTPARSDARWLRERAASGLVGSPASRKRAVRRPRRPTSSRLLAAAGLRGEVAVDASLGFGPATTGIGLSSRYRCGFVTRGVRADRVGAKLRRLLPSGWREMSGGESRPAPGS